MDDFFPVVTVLIALITSLAEIISSNIHRSFSLIWNRYLFFYLAINGLFAFVAWLLMPWLANGIIDFSVGSKEYENSEGFLMITDGWGRVFVSALGYLVVVRSKILTIGDVSIGLDAVYDSFARYCLYHTTVNINNKQSDLLNDIYDDFKGQKRYEYALHDRLSGVDNVERRNFEAEIELIKGSGRQESIKCKRLGGMLLKIVGSKEAMKRVLGNVPKSAL